MAGTGNEVLLPPAADPNLQLRRGHSGATRRLVSLENLNIGSMLTFANGSIAHAVTAGLSYITFAGGTPYSNQLTLPHGLGKVPAAVLLTPVSGVNGACAIWEYAAADTIDLFVQMYWIPGSPVAGAVVYFNWLAIS